MWKRMKENKWRLLLSSVVILLPMVVGFLLWDRLPEHMTTHWGADGVADGWMGRLGAIVILPLILLLFHWVCVLATFWDRSNEGKNRKVQRLVLWIIPVLSWVVNTLLYAVALGWQFDPRMLGAVTLGVTFLVIGNYLPKCRQNRTIGIKLSWTLSSEENWTATHRLAGRVWMIGGLLMLLTMFLPSTWFVVALLVVTLSLILIPVIYSAVLWKRQAKEGKVDKKATLPIGKGGKLAARISMLVGVAIAVVLLIVMFTGEIGVTYGEDSFTVRATYWNELTVDYDEITALELLESHEIGQRTGGFGSARLTLGLFHNETWGDYTRYAYGGAEQAAVITCGEKVLVIAVGDEGETRAVYEALLERIEY